jgi:hypothetical protein
VVKEGRKEGGNVVREGRKEGRKEGRMVVKEGDDGRKKRRW